jgi:outer membrane protein assembly factor BamB
MSLAIALLVLVVSIGFLHNTRLQNWKFVTGNNIDWYPIRGGDSGPLSFDGSSIYVSNLDGYTYSLNHETGKEMWRFRTDMYTIYPKISDDDSLVFISDFDGRLYAIDRQTGKEKWRFVTPGLIKADTEPFVADSIVYFGSRNGVLYALDKQTGEKKWEFKTKGIDMRTIVKDEVQIHFGTFVADENNIYVNSATENALYALNKQTGEELWQFTQYQYVHEKPILGKHSITFRSDEGFFITLDKKTGQVRWKWVAATGDPQSVFVEGNDIYYVDGINALYKYSFTDQTKLVLWKYQSNEFIPDLREWLVVNEKTLLLTTIGTDGIGSLRAINSESGEEIWQLEIGNTPIAPKVDGGVVYVAGGGGIYALEVKSGKKQWHFTGIGISRFIVVTNKNTYLVNIEGENSALFYGIDKETGREEWYMRTGDVDVDTFAYDTGRLYYLSKDQTSVYSIGGNDGKNEISHADFKTILSSDLRKKADKGIIDGLVNPIWYPVVTRMKESKTFEKMLSFQIVQEKREIDRYDVLELTIRHDDSLYVNVWEDVEIQGTFTNENGQTHKIKGFYYDKNTWKVRFAPTSAGRWKWKVRFTSPFIRTEERGSVDVNNSDEPGFVRIQKDNPRRFVFDNGELFAAIGLQDCLIDRNHTGDLLNQLNVGIEAAPQENGNTISLSDLDSYLTTYGPQNAGFNLFRVNIDNCSEKLWKEIHPKGNYYGINAGLREDQLLQALIKHQYRVWMSLMSFKLPMQGSIEDPGYRKALERYIDYIVSRYAAYVDIWELTNEIRPDEEWIKVISEHLRSVDPYKHPITTNWERPDLDGIDIDSVHWYHSGSELSADRVIENLIDREKQWKKPVVFSEIGNQGINWDEHSAQRMRLKLWTAFFKEATLIFWNTSGSLFRHEGESANIYLGPTERQYTKVFREFVNDIDPNITEERVMIEDDGIRGYGMSSEKFTLAYVHNGRSHREVTNTALNLKVKRDGILQWIDPRTGRMMGSREVHAGDQSIRTPMFKIDIAMKITFFDE